MAITRRKKKVVEEKETTPPPPAVEPVAKPATYCVCEGMALTTLAGIKESGELVTVKMVASQEAFDELVRRGALVERG